MDAEGRDGSFLLPGRRHRARAISRGAQHPGGGVQYPTLFNQFHLLDGGQSNLPSDQEEDATVSVVHRRPRRRRPRRDSAALLHARKVTRCDAGDVETALLLARTADSTDESDSMSNSGSPHDDEELSDVDAAARDYTLPDASMDGPDDADLDFSEWRRPTRARVVAGRRHAPRRAGGNEGGTHRTTAKAVDWRGTLLSYVLLNANTLISRDVGKIERLQYFLKKYTRLPDLVLVTEVGGAAGDRDLKMELGPWFLENYSPYWSQRSTTKDGTGPATSGRKVGGGIALLVHKRLHLRAREFKYTMLPNEELLLGGHLGVWQLDPEPVRPSTSARRTAHGPPQGSLVITLAYVPPAGTQGWSAAVRDMVLNAVVRAHDAIRTARRTQDLFPLCFGHFNAPDGGCDLDLTDLSVGMDTARTVVAALPGLLQRPLTPTTRHLQPKVRLPVMERTERARLSVGHFCVRLHRMKSKSARGKYSTALLAQGVAFSESMAARGMIPLNGVMSNLQPTSFTPCLTCKTNNAATGGKCSCSRKGWVLRGTHDVVFVPADLVWRALTAQHGGNDMLRLRVVKEAWTTAVDHRVTVGQVRWAPSAAARIAQMTAASKSSHEAAAPAAPRSTNKRFRKPSNLLHASKVLAKVAEASDADVATRMTTLMLADVDAVEASLVASMGVGRTGGENLGLELEAQAQTLEKRRLHVLRKAWKKLSQARGYLLTALGAVESNNDASKRVDLVAQVTLADRDKKTAMAAFRKAGRLLESDALARGERSAPAWFWNKAARASVPDGAPRAPGQELLERLTNPDGSTISTQQEVIMPLLQVNQQEVHSVGPTLGAACESELVEALANTCLANEALVAAMPELAHDSAVCAAVADPTTPLATVRGGENVDVRLVDLHRRVLLRIQDMREARMAVAPVESKGEAVRRLHPAAYTRLTRPYKVAEIKAGMGKVKDVGDGLGPPSPIIVGCHHACVCNDGDRDEMDRRADLAALLDGEAGPALDKDDDGACPTVELVHILFNRIAETGRLPRRWQQHRILLHYKGKRSDPHCVDNYRGLGIDQALLKLLSLVMLERLDQFLTETKALSLAQGGFLRQRGTPEQAFVLSEVVRAASRHASLLTHLHVAFLDIRRAYDSVLHPILWSKCVDKGIGGHFLATLQAIYHGAEGVLDMNGELSAPVPLECGVLQGNPLSPALFNVYIDDAIRALEAEGQRQGGAPGGRYFGVPLPRVRGRSDRMPLVEKALRTQEDYLPCLFYADDGALIADDAVMLQRMLDCVVSALTRIGLTINIGKTHHLMVCNVNARNDIQFQVARDAMKASPLTVYGTPIKIVDTFEYLGVMMNWRWNWDHAWAEALERFADAVGVAKRAGLQHRFGSLHSQLAYARAKIFCHLTYISALTGAGGTASSAAWRASIKAVQGMLQTIVGHTFARGEALEIEAGLWDQQTRIDTLLLRFWCKLCTMPVESTVYRALCLSLNGSYPYLYMDARPEKENSAATKVQLQPWSQQLAAAAQRLDLSRVSVPFGTAGQCRDIPAAMLHMCPVGLIQLECEYQGTVSLLIHPTLADAAQRASAVAAAARPGAVLRWAVIGAPPVLENQHNKSVWVLPAGTQYDELPDRWTSQLHDACFAAIKRKGNARRQQVVASFLADQIKNGDQSNGSGLRRWATMTAHSFEQPYWHIPDVVAARREMRLRLDMGPNEDYVRRRPFSKTAECRSLPRLDRADRKCYLCGTAASAPPETLEHMILHCAHPEMAALRLATRLQLDHLFTRAEAEFPGLTMPDVIGNDTALLTCLLQCTRLGPIEQQPAGVAIWSPPFYFDEPTARTAAACVHALTGAWINGIRSHGTLSCAGQLGRELPTLATQWALAIFALHRRLVRADSNYKLRNRDKNYRPLPPVPAPTLGGVRVPAAPMPRKKRTKSLASVAGMRAQTSAPLRARSAARVPATPPAQPKRIYKKRGAVAPVAAPVTDPAGPAAPPPVARVARRPLTARTAPAPLPLATGPAAAPPLRVPHAGDPLSARPARRRFLPARLADPGDDLAW